MSTTASQESLSRWTPQEDVDVWEAIPGGVHHVARVRGGDVDLLDVDPAECSACHPGEGLECALHYRLSERGSAVLRTWESNGHTRTALVSCPARVDGEVCGADLTGRGHTSRHIATHDPEDFGLTPLRTVEEVDS